MVAIAVATHPVGPRAVHCDTLVIPQRYVAHAGCSYPLDG
jgi:hypothetical protein